MVDSAGQVAAICGDIRSEGAFAFDTEFVMEDRYESDLCLIQLASRDTVAIIDPFLGLDISEVWALVADEDVETVVHAGQEDLAICVQHSGAVPRAVFDVQIAAGLVGHDYPISLQKLVHALLGIRLHKSKTLTDWRRRPLSRAQVGYGAEDVCYLLEIHRRLRTALEKRGRTAWAREEFERYEDIAFYRMAEEEKIARIKGTGALTGQQLAVVHEVLAWRDETARRLNRPPRAVLKDHLLVEIARHRVTTPDEIRDLRGINIRMADIRALCGIVQKALALPADQWPKVKKSDAGSTDQTILVSLLTAIARSYCQEHDLSYNVTATNRSIRELLKYRVKGNSSDRQAPYLLTGWRRDSVGRLLDDVLAGRKTMRVDTQRGKPILRIENGE